MTRHCQFITIFNSSHEVKFTYEQTYVHVDNIYYAKNYLKFVLNYVDI